MQVRGVADSELERAVEVVGQARCPSDRADLSSAGHASGLAHVHRQRVDSSPADELQGVRRAPARFIRDHRHGRLGMSSLEIGKAEERLLDEVGTRFRQGSKGMQGARPADVAPVGVEPQHDAVAERLP